MRRVFYETCGYEAEEEGVQALLRLPGLANSGIPGSGEMRVFIDTAFADAAFALDLARYISAPFADHVMRTRARWSTTSSSLVAEVAADKLISDKFDASTVSACMRIRENDRLHDAVLYDAAMVASKIPRDGKAIPTPLIADVLIELLELSDEEPALVGATLSGCVIETLDVSEVTAVAGFPTFQNCEIGTIVGWSCVPVAFAQHFDADCNIGGYAGADLTTSGLLRHNLPDAQRVALTVLKKVYAQAGAGRQAPALARGLPLELRPLVDEVVQRLATSGLLELADGRGVKIVRPVRSARTEVMALLEAPSRIASVFKR